LRAAGHHQIAGDLVDIPRRLPARPPLLLMFHGMGDSPRFTAQLTGFDGIAARNRFVVVYVASHDPKRWQLSHQDGNDDIEHVRASIDTIVKRVCADPKRVYLTGFSNGGGFAYRAGCELRNQVAAIAPVSGSYRSLDPCDAGSMPTLEIHGRDPWTSTVTRLVADMKRRNRCHRPPVTNTIATGITRTRWPGCNLERIYNGTIGHQWRRTGPYDTSAQVWRFVSRFSR
jgi:polyhydroxybutyrate depolymerase